MSVSIPLRDRAGEVVAHAILDDVDAALAGRRWYLGTHGYASSRDGLLHRMILGCEVGDGLIVDHANGDKFDCRRSNLRLVTPAQNSWNSRVASGRSGVRGVCWDEGRWRALLKAHGRRHCGGRWNSIEEAAAARRELELLHHYPYVPEAVAA